MEDSGCATVRHGLQNDPIVELSAETPDVCGGRSNSSYVGKPSRKLDSCIADNEALSYEDARTKVLAVTTFPFDIAPAEGPLVPTSLPDVGERFYEPANDRDGPRAFVEVYARAFLPTQHGEFSVLVFRNSLDEQEHVALVKGEVRGQERVPIRLHSECLTGDVLGSLRCDCRAQLELALEALGKSERGILLYMRQEGRGIGLGNKIRAYALQEQGYDTVDANRHLGFDDDLRDYTAAGLMVRALAPTSVEMFTNNPRKIFGLKRLGVDVQARLPLVTRPTPHNERYLITKARRSGHIIPLP
jgi:GTP cyclohydrolase II